MKPLRDEITDQLLHFIVAAAVVAVADLIDSSVSWPAGAVVGLALGAVREVTEGGNIASPGSLRDLLFWTLGGIVGALIT